MNLKIFFIPFAFCFLIFISCEANKSELMYDEVIFSEYKMYMMYSTNEKELKKEIKRLPPLYEKIKYDYYFIYIPKTICRFNKAGKINYYKTPTNDSTKSSFFVSTLAESALFHFNKVLKQIKVN